MNLSVTLQQIIIMDQVTDLQKKSLVMKVINSIGEKDQLQYEEIAKIYETCLLTAIESSSSKVIIMALYVFRACGKKYPGTLKQYMNTDQLTMALSECEFRKLSIILVCLKEGLQILLNEKDYISSISNVLSGCLESKFSENSKQSPILSSVAEIYLLCPSFLPLPHTRLRFTISLMQCVASFPTPTKPETLKHMKSLGNLITVLWETMEMQDIFSTLIAMYSIISNPDKSVEVCPAMAHILSLVHPQVVEGLGPRIFSDLQSSNESFLATLTRLSSWLITWPTAHTTIVHWIKTLVKLLYQNGRNIVPAKITYEQMPKLLDGLRIPICRSGVLSVATLFLMSFQYSPVVFHKTISHILSMLNCLSGEASDSAKETIEGLVKLSHAQIGLYPGYPEVYQPLLDALKKWPPPPEDETQKMIQEHDWGMAAKEKNKLLDSSRNLSQLLTSTPGVDVPLMVYRKRSPKQKVGLKNLGNSCYMNSVLQALLMTDDFRCSVLHSKPNANQRLLVKLQHLFASLCFSHRDFISPKAFHDVSRPPWFSPGMQHDCSEYLRHLMISLHEEEKQDNNLPDYQERVLVKNDSSPLGNSPSSTVSNNDTSSSGNDDSLSMDVESEKGFSVQGSSSSESSINCCDNNAQDCTKDHSNSSSHLTPENGRVESDSDVKSLANNGKSVRQMCSPSKNSCLSAKRKSNFSPLKNRSMASKNHKNGMVLTLSEAENSFDSGISGDIVEDVESQSSTNCEDNNPTPSADLNLNKLSPNKFFVSQLHKSFGGKISTSIKCLNCKTTSIHIDTFTDIHLAFQDGDHCNGFNNSKRKQPERLCNRKSSNVSCDLKIEDMITNYLSTERLTGDNKYECSLCDEKQDAERSIRILETPDHLILTQLRFFYDKAKAQRQKVFTNVEFSEELLLPNISKNQNGARKQEIPSVQSHKSCSESPMETFSSSQLTNFGDELSSSSVESSYERYALYGVVVHSGFSSEGGHYYCYARNSSSAACTKSSENCTGDNMNHSEWFNFNDEKVTKTSFCDISRLTKTFTRDTAYLLFYCKVNNPSCFKSSSPRHTTVEDYSTLPAYLRQFIDTDNLDYQNEQEIDTLRKRSFTSSGTHFRGAQPPRKDDGDDDSTNGGSSFHGGSCGSDGSFNKSYREVF